TLNATAATGTVINWFSSPTATTPIATGATFSPTVSGDSTFYVSGTIVGGNNQRVGLPDNSVASTSSSGTLIYYQIFDVLTPVTISHVYVYPIAAGNVILHISDNAGTVLQTFTVPVTAADINQKTLVPINYTVPA